MRALPMLMGIVNVTPDSFSDGGVHADPVAHGMRLLDEGADILDVGGESTRPGAAPVSPEEEQARVLPVIRALAAERARISVDTRHAATMAAALDAGAAMVNDVSGLRHDPASAWVLAARDCPVVLMHMRGTPETMGSLARYGDVVAEVAAELRERVDAAEVAGIARARLILDPGLGFAKTAEQSLVLLRGLPALAALGLPLLVGASRKSFVGRLSGEPAAGRRLGGSVAAALFAASRGAAMLRVHDVRETRQALLVWGALEVGEAGGW